MTTTAIFIALFAVSAVNVSVETLEGKRVSGSITGLDTDSITLETNGKRSVTPIAKVARIIHEDASDEKLARPRVWIELADGTRLTATSFSVKEDEASLLTTSGQQLAFPRRHVRHVRLKHQDDDLAKQWKKILGTDANADLLVIRKRGTIDFLEGVVGDIDGANVSFTFDGDVIPVKLEKVEGVVYHRRADHEIADSRATILSADGMRLPASAWVLRDEGVLSVTTPLGLQVELPLAALARADLTAGKLVYLGDMQPLSTRWTPYIGGGDELPLLELMFRPRTNQAIDGGPLRLGGEEHAVGLSVHSRTRLVYDLKKKYRRFKAMAGIDDRTRGRGHVELVIKADGKIVYTGEFSGRDKPREVDLDVLGCRKMELLVDYGKDLDIADQMNFVDARLLK